MGTEATGAETTGDVMVGTSGYSYADWVGPYYPPGTERKDFLPIYASEFNFVELNFSYYTQPQPRIFERMLSGTPETFHFCVKGHRSMTHEVGEHIASSTRAFRVGIEPLVRSSRLVSVLLQFPYSFHYTPESRKHLDRLSRLLEGLPLAFEFRNNEWQKDSVYATMRERGIALVSVDEPRLPRLPRPDETVTADRGYLRLHGRNKANWWKGTNTSRYDYLYSEQELADWVTRVNRIVRKVKLLLIAFNNHYKSQAVRNARTMRRMLVESGLERVE